MLRNNLMLPTEALDIPEAIDFDGTDYLSRSSDLMGNADGKTFTFSAWVSRLDVGNIYYVPGGGFFSLDANIFGVVWYNPSGAMILNGSVNSALPISTIIHVMVSVDLSNSANRYVYINDAPQSVTWSNYVNDNINFTNASHSVASSLKGRLAHIFLDYTYRDLSVEANRRLFITADRKPAANQQALNPILYLPLNDPTQPGKNLGTGGDFNLTGVVARSGRGPNQFNAPYSDLNGTSQYLGRASITGIADSKTFTVAFTVNSDINTSNFPYIINTFQLNFEVFLYYNTSIWIRASNAASSSVLGVIFPLGVSCVGRNINVVLSIDLSSTSLRHIYVNGVAASGVSWSPYVNSAIAFSTNITNWAIGSRTDAGANWLNGKLGNVFFDTKYIDLSVPANLAKFVTGTGIDAKPADLGANGELPFGTAPLIYLPMYGNNAGKNYGTGGDFTVNSGPFPGARGPNEFWGNKADFDGTTGYLARTSALAGVIDGKTFSFSAFFNATSGANNPGTVFCITDSAGNWKFIVRIYYSGVDVYAASAAGTTVLHATSTAVSLSANHSVQLCGDMTDSGKLKVYVDGVSLSLTVSPHTNDTINFSNSVVRIGTGYTVSPSEWFKGLQSELYFTTEYIDFSQEANRLKFRDAFGNPVALQPQIEAGTLPNPAIYMRFDPANFGKNSGTGGDFTVNGTITDGGQL